MKASRLVILVIFSVSTAFFSLTFLPSLFARPALADNGTYICYWKPGTKTCEETGATCQPGFEPKPRCADLPKNERDCNGSATGARARTCQPIQAADESSKKKSLDDTESSEKKPLDETESSKKTRLDEEIRIINPLKADTIPDVLNAIAGFLYALAIAVVTIMVLWGGLQILTAAGNPGQIDKGKQTLLWAVIGTVVILIAGGIADLTADILGGKSAKTAGAAGCKWVQAPEGGGRCIPNLSCPVGFSAPRALNCGSANDPDECGNSDKTKARSCVESQ